MPSFDSNGPADAATCCRWLGTSLGTSPCLSSLCHTYRSHASFQPSMTILLQLYKTKETELSTAVCSAIEPQAPNKRRLRPHGGGCTIQPWLGGHTVTAL